MNKKNIIWSLICIAIWVGLYFLWAGLELLLYGEVQPRMVDNIIGTILFISVMINIILLSIVRNARVSEEYYIVPKKVFLDLFDAKEKILNILTSIKLNLQTMDMILTNTIKNEKGEETNTTKFKNIQSFAEYMKCMNDLSLNYIHEQLDTGSKDDSEADV